jgi:predicted RNA-binding protein with PUA-like domain
MKYWLMKTEPDVFSWDDLNRKNIASWDGVRNYQARNFMRDEFKVGDLVLFYHSSCAEPGIQGVAKVVREAYPDPTALDPKSEYFDAASAKAGASRWMMVDIAPVKAFKTPARLQDIRTTPQLNSMLLLRPGQRLSIQPVTREEYEIIMTRWGSLG